MYWETQQAILLADTHFGKAATFRNRGIPVPTGTTDAMLKKLTDTLVETDATSIFFLGDLVHSHSRHETDFVSELLQWREEHQQISMTLVMGNHDRGQRTLFHQLDLTVVDEPFLIDGLALCHYPETSVQLGTYRLAGHVHPSISVFGGGDSLAKIPCFHFGESVGVLPAFGEFTGTHRIKPLEDDQVFAVADGRVIDISRNAQAKIAVK